jgi:ferritin-like metal-binding protein YciE
LGKRAIQVNIQVMRIFTRIRRMITDTAALKSEIDQIKKDVHNQNQNIEVVFQYIDELMEKKDKALPRKRIGFMPDDL